MPAGGAGLRLVEEPDASRAPSRIVGQRARDAVRRLDHAMDLTTADGDAAPRSVWRSPRTCADTRLPAAFVGDVVDEATRLGAARVAVVADVLVLADTVGVLARVL